MANGRVIAQEMRKKRGVKQGLRVFVILVSYVSTQKDNRFERSDSKNLKCFICT